MPGGFWGENITATIDWCEDNYAVTEYVVEFWNSFSSLAICAFAIIGAIHGLKHKLELRFFTWYLALFVIGLGSAAFHGTLLYEYQMLDEVPMMWGVFIFSYVLWEMFTPRGRPNYVLAVFIFLYSLGMSWLHISFGFVVLFQVHFVGIMLAVQATVINWNKNRPVPEAKKLMLPYFATVAIAGAGWIIDRVLCDHINTYLPINPQLHSVWHVFIGLHCYVSVMWAIIYRANFLGMEPYLWYWAGILPFVSFKKDNPLDVPSASKKKL